jgi:tetratricopeptide (TPR) repeat protein
MDEFFKNIKDKIINRETKNNLKQAEEILIQFNEKNHIAISYGLLAEIQYWKGEIAEKESKLEIYKNGMEYGKIGISIDPNNIESQFWTGVCMGLFGDEQGILNSFFLLGSLETSIEKSLKLDESYFYGGPLRVAGLFYHRIPSWPISKGDNNKALDYLLKALKFGPEFCLNHLYISYIYKALNQKNKAKEHLNWILEFKGVEKFKNEIENYKIKAKKELEIL